MFIAELGEHSVQSPVLKEPLMVILVERFYSQHTKSLLVHAEMQDGRDVTLKFPHIDPVRIRNEYMGLCLAYEHDVHVPKPIAYVVREEAPTEGFIMERIHGFTLESAASQEGSILLGKELKKLHAIDVPMFGTATKITSRFHEGDGYVESLITPILSHLPDEEHGKDLMTSLWNEIKAYTKNQKPKFIHRDIHRKNAVFNALGELFLLDFESWHGGDPFCDVGGYLYYILRRKRPEAEFNDFLSSYMEGKPLEDVQKLAVLFYSLLSAGRFVEMYDSNKADPMDLKYALKNMKRVTSFAKAKLK